VAGIELAHANEAEIRKIGLPISVSPGERGELGNVLPAVKSQSYETLLQHREDDGHASQVKPRFCQDCLTGQERLADLLSHANRPLVMAIVAVGEGDEEPGIRNAPHERANPLREDRSRGPRTEPASRMNDCRGLPVLAFSSWSRTILPWGTPVFAATCSSHAASSLGTRTVIV